jgi:hypothetical protein
VVVSICPAVLSKGLAAAVVAASTCKEASSSFHSYGTSPAQIYRAFFEDATSFCGFVAELAEMTKATFS